MKFWDTSALVPLVVEEQTSNEMRALLLEDSEVVIAWLTPIELSSAIWRKWRENGDDAVRIRAERRVRSIAKASVLVDDIRAVTRHAQDLFERNPLKAADAAQLASALVAAGLLGQMPLVTLDHTLANAARNEGLAVIGRSPTS